MRKMMAKYGAFAFTPHGLKRCIQVIIPREDKPALAATFGNISLRRNQKVVRLVDDAVKPRPNGRTELVQRLLADKCEICGSTEDVQVHHVRRLADLKKPGRKAPSRYRQNMLARKRKTLVLCRRCHVDLHAGRLPGDRPLKSKT
jgi:hypothetical protein